MRFTILLVLMASGAFAQSCITQPCVNFSDPDVVHYGYSGDVSRGGEITTRLQSDQVFGQAEVYAGYYSNTYPNGWYIGDGVRVTNPAPNCGPVSYLIASVERSYRADGVPDKIQQVGTAWWVPQYPQQYSAYESGNLNGNGKSTFPGRAYIITDTVALLPPGCTPQNGTPM